MAEIALITVYFWECPVCGHQVKTYEAGGIPPNAIRHMNTEHQICFTDAMAQLPQDLESARLIWAFNVRPD